MNVVLKLDADLQSNHGIPLVVSHLLEVGWVDRFLSPLKAGAPNDRFLSNAFKRCFRLSGVLLKLCTLILSCAKIKF